MFNLLKPFIYASVPVAIVTPSVVVPIVNWKNQEISFYKEENNKLLIKNINIEAENKALWNTVEKME